MDYTKRRLDLKLSELRFQADKVAHERVLLRQRFVTEKSTMTPEELVDITEQIRSLTKQFDALCVEIRQTIDKRYLKEWQDANNTLRAS